MVNLEELLNRRPNSWGNLTIKEFERDIKILQDACRMYESAIAEDDATKTRLLAIIE